MFAQYFQYVLIVLLIVFLYLGFSFPKNLRISHLRYGLLGSHLPRNKRQLSFLKCRAAFEKQRDGWISEGKTGFVAMRDGEVLKFSDAWEHCTDDLGFCMEIRSREEEFRDWRANSQPTFSLVATPFLDIDVPASEFEADRILQARGYPPIVQWCFRKLAWTGLHWNSIWWEWGDLSFSDFLVGWATNLVVVLVPVLFALSAVYVPWLFFLVLLGLFFISLFALLRKIVQRINSYFRNESPQ